MLVTIGIGDEAFEQALQAASRVEDSPLLEMSGLVDAAQGFVERAWEKVQFAVSVAFRQGPNVALDLAARTVAEVEAIIAEAREVGDFVRQAVNDRIREFLRQIVDRCLEVLRPSVDVAGVQLTLSKVSIQQTVAISGSLGISITQAVSMAASGEMSVGAEYVTPGD